MGKISGSVSGMNNPDHISENLKTIFGLKYFSSLMKIRDPRRKKFGSGINIPDLQHCSQVCTSSWQNQTIRYGTVHTYHLKNCKIGGKNSVPG
jgi:hypothetical protein